MITNLLGKPVTYSFAIGDPNSGEICAVFVDRGELKVSIVNESGEIVTAPATNVQLIINPYYWVKITWTVEKKIQAIKKVREILNLGLREAKDFVEKNMNPLARSNTFLVKENVTKQEAERMKLDIESGNLMAEIGRYQ